MSINSTKRYSAIKKIGLIVSQVLKEMRQAAETGNENRRFRSNWCKLLEKKVRALLQS